MFTILFSICTILPPSRSSHLVEKSVDELLDLLKSSLTQAELDKLVPDHESSSQPQEPDTYTLVLNYFTQRNTEALVKCRFFTYLILGAELV